MYAVIGDWGIDTPFAALRQEICNSTRRGKFTWRQFR